MTGIINGECNNVVNNLAFFIADRPERQRFGTDGFS
jgi:hypothetical protein